jgi:hypothetical protein
MNFYNNSESGKNPYNNSSLGLSEPNMRDELAKILHTENRGGYYIYRRVRRDSDGCPMLEPSVLNNRSGEASHGVNSGMRYLFDDHMVIGYLSRGSNFHETGNVKEYGDSRKDLTTVYLEYDVLHKITGSLTDMPDEYDKILEPQYDINGKLISPLKINIQYDIGSSEPYKLDKDSRIEYFKLNLVSKMDKSIKL